MFVRSLRHPSIRSRAPFLEVVRQIGVVAVDICHQVYSPSVECFSFEMSYLSGGYIEPRESTRDVETQRSSQPSVILRSLTVLQLKKSLKTAFENSAEHIIVDGQIAKNFTIVGEIISVENQMSGMEYTIDDGTAEVTVKHFSTRNTTSSAEEEPLEKHTWVTVHGLYRPFKGPNDRDIASTSIRPTTDHNEITLHFARCIQQGLYLTKGPLPSSKPSEGPKQSTVPRPALSTPMGVTGPQASFTGVKDAIRQLLIQQGEMHIQAICNHLDEDFSKKSIRAAVEELARDGLLFQGSADDSYVWSG